VHSTDAKWITAFSEWRELSSFISELICGLATALLVTEAYDIDFFIKLLPLYNTNK
jgi:hypothetical protein